MISAITECFNEHLLQVSLSAFTSKITMSKEMLIKSGTHCCPKPPIYANASMWERPLSRTYANNGYYLSLSFWPILLYLYFLQYKRENTFSDVKSTVCISLPIHILYQVLLFICPLLFYFKVSFTLIMQLNLWIFFLSRFWSWWKSPLQDQKDVCLEYPVVLFFILDFETSN